MLSQSIIIEINGKKYVKKSYGEIVGITKWIIANFPFVQLLYPFETDPWKRMVREYLFFVNPPRAVRTPIIIGYYPNELVIIREYIDGKKIMLSTDDAVRLGEKLAEMHNENYCLGDTKPSNFVVLNNELYVIDAEQAIKECYEDAYRVWDVLFHILAVSITYTGAPPREISNYTEDFLYSYVKKSPKALDYASIRRIIRFFSSINPLFGAKVQRILFEN
jgi:tRNA A-37 threonylcarbamoyl transferase component Bud32